MFLVIKRIVLEDILADPYWSKRFEAATNNIERVEVAKDYAKQKGLRFKEVAIT